MLRSLTIKLTLASLAASLISVILVGLYAYYQTGAAFDNYVQNQQSNALVQMATRYYEEHHNWHGFNTIVREMMLRSQNAPPPNERNSRLPGAPPNRQMPILPGYVIANQNGIAVTNGREHHIGDTVSAKLLQNGLPITVDSVQVGTVVMSGTTADLNPQEREFLARTNQILLAAMLGGSLSALIICLVLTRFLTRPVRALTAAMRAMRSGTLRQEVQISGPDELGELVTTFNQLSHELAQATQLRRQMTADIAHELRTPLSVLLGYIETMRDGLLPPSNDRFQAMFVEANQLQRLVDDLRLLSLADAGELSLHTQPTDPNDLLQSVSASFAPRAAQQHILFDVQPAPQTHMLVDQERMLQVLGNLITNALRYTPAGGRIGISATLVERHIQLEVADTGCGIAPEVLPSIFERLYRADQSRTASSGESGLGLAIVKAIVEAHGGSVRAESTVGVGTRMFIRVPQYITSG